MNESNVDGLRATQRRALRARVMDAALRLFAEQGFEATTVEQIAAAANTSPRTFYRYFGTKDGVVLAKFDDTGDRLAESLRSRPEGEPVWTSLRRAFDYFVEYSDDESKMSQSAAIQTVIAESDVLRAGHLQRMARMQELSAEVVMSRTSLSAWDARAVVAAAFACLATAGDASAAQGSTFGQALDAAMAAVVLHIR